MAASQPIPLASAAAAAVARLLWFSMRRVAGPRTRKTPRQPRHP